MSESVYLTPKTFYQFFVTCNYLSSKPRKLFRNQLSMTLTSFWDNLLSEIVPGAIIDIYFDTSVKRNRQLSDMMNHTKPKSMPLKLYNAMEEYLTDDRFLGALRWLHGTLESSINPTELNAAVTAFEDQILLGDSFMRGFEGFFLKLRMNTDSLTNERIAFLAALRLTFIGIYSIYGYRANESSALQKLRSSNVCKLNQAWEMAEMKKYQPGYGILKARETIEPAEASPIKTDKSQLLKSAMDRIYDALPNNTDFITNGKANGWYVVANWTDEYISLNDKPWATYNGSNELALIKNGTLLYVSAVEYNGIHCSPGMYGYTEYNGIVGCVPLNLMIRIEESDKK